MTSPHGLHFCQFLTECVKSVFIITFCWSSVFKMWVVFHLIIPMTVGAKGIKHGQADTIWLVGLKTWKRSSSFRVSFSAYEQPDGGDRQCFWGCCIVGIYVRCMSAFVFILADGFRCHKTNLKSFKNSHYFPVCRAGSFVYSTLRQLSWRSKISQFSRWWCRFCY